MNSFTRSLFSIVIYGYYQSFFHPSSFRELLSAFGREGVRHENMKRGHTSLESTAATSSQLKIWWWLMNFSILSVYFSVTLWKMVRDGSKFWRTVLYFSLFPRLRFVSHGYWKDSFSPQCVFLGKSQISRIHACEFLSNILSTEIHRIVCILIFLICRQTLSYELLVTM